MSRSPEQIVRQLYEMWRTFDLDAARRLYAPDVAFDWSRRQMDAVVAEGKEAVVEATRELREPWDEARMEIEELVEDGERVIACIHVQGRGRASGAVADAHVAHVWTIRDGLVQRMEYYGDQAEAMATVETAP